MTPTTIYLRSPVPGEAAPQPRVFAGGREARGPAIAARPPSRRIPLTIEGELVAKSTGTVSSFTLGDRVFHQKFGNGNVTGIDGNKLTIAVRPGRGEAGGGLIRREGVNSISLQSTSLRYLLPFRPH